MVQKEVFLTPEGLERLKSELEHLSSVRRQQVADQIHRAKELGGTADNAEYDDAKNEQAFVEGRILTLENLIMNAVIIEAEKSTPNKVKLGTKVTVISQDGDHEYYAIVGSAEADPSQGKISNESPAGQALLGKRVGDKAKVRAPAGTSELLVIAIE